MKKKQIKIRTKSHITLRMFHFFYEAFWGMLFLAISLGILFFIFEAYAEYYYTNSKGLPQTVMNLPIYENSEFRSWDHKANTDTEHGFGTPTPKIHINSLGLREDEIPKQKTKKRYLLLGDSFTFGMGVDQTQSFSERLQYSLGEKYHQVINGGVIGQSIDDAFMYLKHEGIKLQPNYVVFNFFVGNDITELRRHKWKTNENNKIMAVTDTVLRVNEKHQLRFREEKEPSSYFLFWLNQKLQVLKQKYGANTEIIDPTLTWPVFLPYDHPYQDPLLDEYWIQFEEALKQMNEFTKNNGIQLIISVIPMDVQVSKKYWGKYPGMPFNEEAYEAKRPQKHIQLLGKRYDIPVLDFLPLLQQTEKETGESLYFKNDPHFNILGHRMTASFIWEFLMQNYLR